MVAAGLKSCQRRIGRRALFATEALTLVVCTLTLICCAPRRAPAAELTTAELKAALLYQIPKYVEWPSGGVQSSREIVIGIVGSDPFGSEIDRLMSGRTIGGRPIRLARFAGVGDLSPVDVLYIGSSERDRIQEILAAVSGWRVLTVGESQAFLAAGGIVNLIVQPGRIRFEINRGAAERSGLRISGALVSLADRVI